MTSALRGRYLIGLLACRTEADRRRQRLCLETWVPDAEALGMDVLFLIGTGSKRESAKRDGRELLLPCSDDYPSLPQKTHAFCRWALTQPAWEWLFKADTDTYVAAYRLATYQPRGDYTGCEWRAWIGYASGGAGYILGRRAVQSVAAAAMPATGSEDMEVGKILRRAGIALVTDPRFVPFGTETRRPRRDNNIVTAHQFARHCRQRWAEDAEARAESLWRETHAEISGAP